MPRMAERSLGKRLWYDLLQLVCQLTAVVAFRIRARGQHRFPAAGGVLVLSNHQSNLDPVLVGISVPRRLNYLARETLFGFAPFRWLIRSLDAIPIDRDGFGLAGIKETLRRLKRGEAVLVFPEGTRSSDGEIAPLKPGLCAIARRSGAALVPVAIEGAYAAWPRRRKLPRRSTIRVEIGPPITPAEVATMDDDALMAEIERRIRACFAQARASVRRAAR
jgi:1-acyl-sn-glycerol-3-phosphate acyltransferase